MISHLMCVTEVKSVSASSTIRFLPRPIPPRTRAEDTSLRLLISNLFLVPATAIVEEELSYPFDLRICRRACGQRLIDRKVGVNVVSKVMDHARTATTKRHYCTMDDISEMLPGPATEETFCEGDSEHFRVSLSHPEGV